MSDCSKCWETPCACGHGYSHWPMQKRIDLASVILAIPKEKLLELIETKHLQKVDK